MLANTQYVKSLAQICTDDPYCCNTSWDGTCVGEVATICGQTCPTTSTCAHTLCATGSKLSASCDACVAQICAADPYCCSTKWDNACVGQVQSVCGQSCN